MSSARQRQLVKLNRLLVRQEGLAERDLAKVIKGMAGRIAERHHYGAEDALLQLVDEARPEIVGVLEKRLLQTALIFGGFALDRFEGMAKSYYPGLPEGLGPVRGGPEDEREVPCPWYEAKDAREVFESTILRWVKLHALDRAVTITRTLKEAVRKVLVDSFADGTGEAGTSKAIRDKIGRALSASSAARIARTEMHTAANLGADEAARSTGLEMVKEWAAAEDSRTRASHATADGQEVHLDEPFNVGGASLMMPGDPSGPAKEIINCRCTVLHHPIIGGEIIR
jgi:hypothetical protein